MSTAKRNYREYLKSENVRLKKYFYVLRPLLACMWIMDKGTPPPMPFRVLADEYLDAEIKPVVEELLQRKMQTPELGEGKRIAGLNLYIDGKMTEIENALQTYGHEKRNDWNALNKAFPSLLE